MGPNAIPCFWAQKEFGPQAGVGNVGAVENVLDLGEALGASEPASVQILVLYIPNKDRDGIPITDQESCLG